MPVPGNREARPAEPWALQGGQERRASQCAQDTAMGAGLEAQGWELTRFRKGQGPRPSRTEKRLLALGEDWQNEWRVHPLHLCCPHNTAGPWSQVSPCENGGVLHPAGGHLLQEGQS